MYTEASGRLDHFKSRKSQLSQRFFSSRESLPRLLHNLRGRTAGCLVMKDINDGGAKDCLVVSEPVQEARALGLDLDSVAIVSRGYDVALA